MTNLSYTLTDLNSADNSIAVPPGFDRATGKWASYLSDIDGGFESGRLNGNVVQTKIFTFGENSSFFSIDGKFNSTVEASRNGLSNAFASVEFSIPVIVMPHTAITFTSHVLLQSELTETWGAFTNVKGQFILGVENSSTQYVADTFSLNRAGNAERELQVSWINETDTAKRLVLGSYVFAETAGISLVPEPAAYAMFTAGALVLLAARRRKLS